MMIYVHVWSHVLNYVRFLEIQIFNNSGVLAHKLLNRTHCGDLSLFYHLHINHNNTYIPFFYQHPSFLFNCMGVPSNAWRKYFIIPSLLRRTEVEFKIHKPPNPSSTYYNFSGHFYICVALFHCTYIWISINNQWCRCSIHHVRIINLICSNVLVVVPSSCFNLFFQTNRSLLWHWVLVINLFKFNILFLIN